MDFRADRMNEVSKGEMTMIERMAYYYTMTDLNDLNEFEQAALKAKAAGATHMMVGQLPRSRWMWERDLTDPYCNWMMSHVPLFRLACPPQLRKYMPMDFYNEGLELVIKRCEILKKHGMNGALFTNEPFWLPDDVFMDHPDWRGPRMDHPRRARNWYYAPCVDNPEVLEMYTWAAKEIAEKTGIDLFYIKSNDAGGGLCWSNGTYVGPNGPSACKHRPMAARVRGFVEAIAQGAKQGGVDAVIHFNTNIGFKLEEVGANGAWHEVTMPGVIINERDMDGKQPYAMGPSERMPYVRGMTDFVGFTQWLENAQAGGKKYLVFGSGAENLELMTAYTKAASETPASGLYGRTQLMKKVAADLVGEENAQTLVDAWFAMHEGFLHFSHDGLGLIMYGCVHQRWINRPFVLFPEKLTEEEYGYYRPYQFQALDAKHANDLLDMQNIECVRGFSAAFLLSETVRKATASFNQAIAKLSVLAEKLEGEKKEDVLLKIRTIRVYQSLMRTCANAAAFQTLVDDIDFEWEPPLDCRWPTRNDPRIEQYQNITRDEIDNAYELANLLDGYEEKILQIVPADKEDIFVFGPNIVKQIRKKAQTMIAHQLEGNRVFERHNI